MFMFDNNISNCEPKRPRLVRLAMMFLWLDIISVAALIFLAVYLPAIFFIPAVFLVPLLVVIVPAFFIWIYVKGQFD